MASTLIVPSSLQGFWVYNTCLLWFLLPRDFLLSEQVLTVCFIFREHLVLEWNLPWAEERCPLLLLLRCYFKIYFWVIVSHLLKYSSDLNFVFVVLVLDLFILFYSYECYWYGCVYVPCAYLIPSEARGGHQISLNWNYRWLWAAVWVLEIESKSCVRAFSMCELSYLFPLRVRFAYSGIV